MIFFCALKEFDFCFILYYFRKIRTGDQLKKNQHGLRPNNKNPKVPNHVYIYMSHNLLGLALIHVPSQDLSVDW